MKIRVAFISNSSSCSFLIYGFSMDDCDFEELCRKQGLIPEEASEDLGAWEVVEHFEKKLSEAGLAHEIPSDFDRTYIGRSWDKVADDQTGQQFKEEVGAALKSIFGDSIDKELGTEREAWRNG